MDETVLASRGSGTGEAGSSWEALGETPGSPQAAHRCIAELWAGKAGARGRGLQAWMGQWMVPRLCMRSGSHPSGAQGQGQPATLQSEEDFHCKRGVAVHYFQQSEALGGVFLGAQPWWRSGDPPCSLPAWA